MKFEIYLRQSSAIPDSLKEAGTGYFKQEWNGKNISADMGNIKISTNSNVPSWGGVYYQYFEDLDEIKSAETPLNMKKNLLLVTFLNSNTLESFLLFLYKKSNNISNSF